MISEETALRVAYWELDYIPTPFPPLFSSYCGTAFKLSAMTVLSWSRFSKEYGLVVNTVKILRVQNVVSSWVRTSVGSQGHNVTELMLSVGLWRWYINITVTILDIGVGVSLAADSQSTSAVWVSGLPLGPLTRFYLCMSFVWHLRRSFNASSLTRKRVCNLLFLWVWNGVHSASWVQLRSYLIEK
jgi:hypothetical protein